MVLRGPFCSPNSRSLRLGLGLYLGLKLLIGLGLLDGVENQILWLTTTVCVVSHMVLDDLSSKAFGSLLLVEVDMVEYILTETSLTESILPFLLIEVTISG